MKKAQMAIEEARMVLPGLQALFGFQMIAIFNARFETLTAISIALIMAPAAYHRIVEPEVSSEFFIRFTSVLIAAAMVTFMISLTLDAYIVAILIVRSGVLGAAIAFAVFTVSD